MNGWREILSWKPRPRSEDEIIPGEYYRNYKNSYKEFVFKVLMIGPFTDHYTPFSSSSASAWNEGKPEQGSDELCVQFLRLTPLPEVVLYKTLKGFKYTMEPCAFDEETSPYPVTAGDTWDCSYTVAKMYVVWVGPYKNMPEEYSNCDVLFGPTERSPEDEDIVVVYHWLTNTLSGKANRIRPIKNFMQGSSKENTVVSREGWRTE
jgi:hypothetical protein